MQWNPVAVGDLPALIGMGEEDLVEWMEANSDDAVDVDKAWHGIHAVLTNTAEPDGSDLDALVLGGTPFGEDLGFGPTRYLRPKEVMTVAALIEPITPAAFEARINLERLAELNVYPMIWDRAEERSSNIEYLVDGYKRLRALFLSASTERQAIIVSLM